MAFGSALQCAKHYPLQKFSTLKYTSSMLSMYFPEKVYLKYTFHVLHLNFKKKSINKVHSYFKYTCADICVCKKYISKLKHILNILSNLKTHFESIIHISSKLKYTLSILQTGKFSNFSVIFDFRSNECDLKRYSSVNFYHQNSMVLESRNL